MQGNVLLSLWPKEISYKYEPAPSPGTHPKSDHSLLGIEIAGPSKVIFPYVQPDNVTHINKGDFNSLDIQTQQTLLDISMQDMLTKLPTEDREVSNFQRIFTYTLPILLTYNLKIISLI